MNLLNIQEIPVWNVFVLFLIIASNYIGELFPCRVQDLLMHNVYLKHLISYLTLVFFVVLTDTALEKKKSNEIFIDSLKLYFVFLLLINCNKIFFTIALSLLGLIYIIRLIIQDYENGNLNDNYKLQLLNKIKKIIYTIFFIVLVIGFIIYVGEKKIEYKKKFRYLTFIFGKPNCKGKSPNTKLVESFIYAFK